MFSWQPNVDNSILLLHIPNTDDMAMKNAVEASAEKIISLLHNIILDDSLYLIFEWNKENAVLTASVTDADKKNDGAQHIRCEFSGLRTKFSNLEPSLQAREQKSVTENVKFLLQDYLASCTAFFQFSLVAIFHSSSRTNTELL